MGLYLLVCSMMLTAQIPEMAFHYFGQDETFVNTGFQNISEDHSGNIWIATSGSGIVRFNGYTIRSHLKLTVRYRRTQCQSNSEFRKIAQWGNAGGYHSRGDIV